MSSTEESLATALGGVACVLVAPFRPSGEVDVGAAETLVRKVDEAGIQALTMLGNTAEVFQLTGSERRELLAATAAGRERATLLAGIAGPQAEALSLAEHAAELGYDAVMLHDPPDPLAGERGLVGLVGEFADRSPLPVVLYVRTPRLGRAALAELVGHPRVAAVKYARADLATLSALLHDPASRDACTWICGLAESMVAPMRGLGVVGFTSGLANVRPDLAFGVWEASRTGDLEALDAALGPILPFEAMRTRAAGRHNVSVVKAALAESDFAAGEVRRPCEPLGEAELRELRVVLAGLPAARAASGATA